MKKLYIAIMIVMLGLGASAQSDGFFGSWNEGGNRTEGGMSTPTLDTPGTPIGSTENTDAPVGSGLLVMTALGAGYAISKRKK